MSWHFKVSKPWKGHACEWVRGEMYESKETRDPSNMNEAREKQNTWAKSTVEEDNESGISEWHQAAAATLLQKIEWMRQFQRCSRVWYRFAGRVWEGSRDCHRLNKQNNIKCSRLFIRLNMINRTQGSCVKEGISSAWQKTIKCLAFQHRSLS